MTLRRAQGSIPDSTPPVATQDTEPPSPPTFNPASLLLGRQAAADAIPAAVKRLASKATTGYYTRGEDPRGDLLALHTVATGGKGGDKGGDANPRSSQLALAIWLQSHGGGSPPNTLSIKVVGLLTPPEEGDEQP